MHRHGGRTYTIEEACRAGQDFLAQHGRLMATDLGHTQGLPSQTQIYQLFGSVALYKQAIKAHTRRSVFTEKQAKFRTCLRCDGKFLSKDNGHRICTRCKTNVEWEESGDWMNNTVVVDTSLLTDCHA